MADFRKWFYALAVVTLLVVLSVPAGVKASPPPSIVDIGSHVGVYDSHNNRIACDPLFPFKDPEPSKGLDWVRHSSPKLSHKFIRKG